MRRKRQQREEVRKLLAAVRTELAAQKHHELAGRQSGDWRPVVHLNEIIQRAQTDARHG